MSLRVSRSNGHLRESILSLNKSIYLVFVSCALGLQCGVVRAEENASNPLAAVNNTDIRWQYIKSNENDFRVNDFFVDGAFMATPKLKIKYELHYWETDLSGSSERGWESALLKAIYFPREGALASGSRYRLAAGLDYVHDFGNTDKGIGTGASQIAPFLGVAIAKRSGISLIPLLQHFESVSGEDFRVTSARLIAIQPLKGGSWLKFDLKIPYDWENESLPADGEVQYGGLVTEKLKFYVDGKFGIGSERTYDWGVGIGLRFSY